VGNDSTVEVTAAIPTDMAQTATVAVPVVGSWRRKVGHSATDV
jgi:hypothetical protein